MPVQVEVDVPAFRLALNERDVIEAASEAVAASLVRRTLAGVDARGVPLPRPETGGRPLVRTGRMLSQVTAVSGGVTVVGDRARAARALARPGGPAAHVFEAGPADERAAVEAAERVIQARFEEE